MRKYGYGQWFPVEELRQAIEADMSERTGAGRMSDVTAARPDVWRVMYGAVWVPMVPDSCLLPNRRRNAHWSVQNDATQALRMAAKHGKHMMDPVHPLPLAGRVEIRYSVFWGGRYPGKRKLPDVDALPTACKPILDGLIDAGILTDDSDRYVGQVSARQMREELKYHGQGVYVRIMEIEQAAVAQSREEATR